MDELLSLTLPSEEFSKEHYEELLKIIKERYDVTLEQILESSDRVKISDNMYYALDMMMIDPMKWLNFDIVRKDPNLDINFVNELRKYTCQFNKICNNAGEACGNNHLPCLKYFDKIGANWHMWSCYPAVEKGNLECLKYAVENGCPLNIYLCQHAVKNGQLECLKYLHKNGYPIIMRSCLDAKNKGHVECITYLHENGCSWNMFSCKNAIEKDHLECLKYAVENGCPFDKKECIKLAKKCGRLDCRKYLESL